MLLFLPLLLIKSGKVLWVESCVILTVWKGRKKGRNIYIYIYVEGGKRELEEVREILAWFERFLSNDRRTDIAGLNNLYERWKLRTWPRLFANVEKEDI